MIPGVPLVWGTLMSMPALHGRGDAEDLVGAGLVALIGAIDNCRPGREEKFTSYAIVRIRGAFLDYLSHSHWEPRHYRRKRGTAAPRHTLESLDDLLPDEAEAIPDPRLEDQNQIVRRLAVMRSIAALSPREREVLRWRFWGEEGQAEIANRLGISQTCCSKVYRQALQKLQATAEAFL